MAYLRHVVNGSTVAIYELGEQTVIGRSAECPIKIDDPTVSGQHVKIEKLEAGWFASDLNSTNGVFANGNKIENIALEPGVVLTIGTHDFEYLPEVPNNLERTMKIRKSWIPGIYFAK